MAKFLEKILVKARIIRVPTMWMLDEAGRVEAKGDQYGWFWFRKH